MQKDIKRTKRRIAHIEKALINGRNQRRIAQVQRLLEKGVTRREKAEISAGERLALLKDELKEITERGKRIADRIIELETAEDIREDISEMAVTLIDELRCINDDKREIKGEISAIEKQLGDLGSQVNCIRDMEGELALRKARRDFLLEEYERELKRLDSLNRQFFGCHLLNKEGEKYV